VSHTCKPVALDVGAGNPGLSSCLGA
jgi:hypothetical protein